MDLRVSNDHSDSINLNSLPVPSPQAEQMQSRMRRSKYFSHEMDGTGFGNFERRGGRGRIHYISTQVGESATASWVGSLQSLHAEFTWALNVRL